MRIKLFTIGFVKKNASKFFGLLSDAKVKRVIDTRLHRTSQLAGFTKEQDLPFFLQKLCGIDYVKEPILAPTKELLSDYRKRSIDWTSYEEKFNALIQERQIESKLIPAQLDHACLLCSEDKPHYCHRRLVAEYLKGKWPNVDIVHL